MIDPEGITSYNEPSTPIGLQPMIKPLITELAVRPHTYVVIFTDGLLRAGERYGEDIELLNYLSAWPVMDGRGPADMCEDILRRAMELDRGEPSDDMSILVLAVLPGVDRGSIRRLYVSAPFEEPTWPSPA